MNKILDLKRYRETKEYKTILDKCKNREENLRSIIRQAFIGQVDNTGVYSKHDIYHERVEFLMDRLEEIKSKSEGARILKEEINKEIDRALEFITEGIQDQYGVVNSGAIYNALDKERCLLQENKYFQFKLDGIIAALEKKEEGDGVPKLTSNDPEEEAPVF